MSGASPGFHWILQGVFIAGYANQVIPSLGLSAPCWASSVIFLGCMLGHEVYGGADDVLDCVWGILCDRLIIFLCKPHWTLQIIKESRG